ncbi:hypothetical protein CDL15_Pgr028769 [Punica granatum]|uniref:Uncharacterized protein n=1 Tax=Punica granatum TaxID=22663 RepID=A0A218VYG0_PUNGR|nr:hypothetical protein CDL15_Pgr028769 [Punica granatum]
MTDGVAAWPGQDVDRHRLLALSALDLLVEGENVALARNERLFHKETPRAPLENGEEKEMVCCKAVSREAKPP